MPSFPIQVEKDDPFPVENIPFGIFSPSNETSPRACTAIGQYVIDLSTLEKNGYFEPLLSSSGEVFSQTTLNKFAALSRDIRQGVRKSIIKLLLDEASIIFKDASINEKVSHAMDAVKMHLPMHTTEFTDYSAAEEHVGNCYAMTGMKFVAENNFYYSPIGYTARTSSLRVSGSNITRPNGIFKDTETGQPRYQPTKKLDYELEMAVFLSRPLPYGQIVSPDDAAEHIFGFVLMNDWSSRDIQMYESIPVGPINSKAFGTTLAPWVIMPEALAPAATEPRNQKDGQVPVHMLHSSLAKTTYDITCHASLARAASKDQTPVKISTSNVKHMYYSPAQLIAHRSASGCGLVTGELVGMGTVSSPEEHWPDRSVSRAGCLFEMTWDGTREIEAGNVGGKWLEDGDTVTLEAWAMGENGVKIGFGQVVGKVLPAARIKGPQNRTT